MLRGNPPPPQHPFFSFSFYLFSFTFQKKIWKFRGGGLNPLNPPLKYALAIQAQYQTVQSAMNQDTTAVRKYQPTSQSNDSMQAN